jgi:manganese efflux pump family protein
MWAAVALALGLAMDAAAVAAARGVVGERRELVILPLLFGGFQAGMAALGWITGDWGGEYFEAFDHWIAFVLLAGMGTKMIVDAWRPAKAKQEARTGAALYFALAIATSIDACAAGIALPMMAVDPWLAVALIGVVATVLSFAGFLLGRAIGARFGTKLGIAGGVVLIAIAVKILVDHLD